MAQQRRHAVDFCSATRDLFDAEVTMMNLARHSRQKRVRFLIGLTCVTLNCVEVSVAQAQTTVFAGGTLIDGTRGPPIANAVVVISDSVIACAGTRAACAPHLGQA